MPMKSKKAVAGSNRRAIDHPLPRWPALTPLPPSIDLHLETLLTDQILLIRNLFTSTLCRNYVSFLSSLPLNTTKIQPKRDEALRLNDRFQIEDPAFAEMLWGSTALRDLVTGSEHGLPEGEKSDHHELEKIFGGKVLGLNPRIRIYRYSSFIFSETKLEYKLSIHKGKASFSENIVGTDFLEYFCVILIFFSPIVVSSIEFLILSFLASSYLVLLMLSPSKFQDQKYLHIFFGQIPQPLSQGTPRESLVKEYLSQCQTY